MVDSFKKSLILFFITVLSNIAVYLLFSSDINVVCRYLDGPHYLEVAKTFYENVTSNNPAQMPEWYFSVHLIAFPFFIRIFNLFLPDCISMLSTVTFFSALTVVLYYLLLKEGDYVKKPFWISLVFIFFTPRWLLYHSVAGSEAIFLFFVFSSLLFYKKRKPFLAVLASCLASITRVFGVLMFPLLFLLFLKDKKRKQAFLTVLIPFSLFLHFLYYHFRFGDFFAYFRWNTKQIKAIPFITQIVLRIIEDKTAIAEMFILMLLSSLAGIKRLKKYPELFWYSILFFLPIPFLIQVDFSRFFIPIIPFVFLVAFENFFTSKLFKLVFPFLIILSYFYILGAIPTNLFPEKAFLQLTKGIL